MSSSFKIVEATLPKWNRYKSLFLEKSPFSILRELQYEVIKKTPLKGKVLDFGGGRKADYLPLLQCEKDSYEAANIDPDMEPTWLTKPGGKLECPKESYDTVISFNTLEHIFDARQALEEMTGALKKGGELFCAVPFLYPVHAHPDDFYRPTASWFGQALDELGYESGDVQPLLWGPFSTGLVTSGVPGPLKKIRTHYNLCLDLLYARVRFSQNETTFSGPVGKTLQNHALGYFVHARKR